MAATTWLKQTKQPLFQDLIWSRPENKRQAGKLLIIGGRAESFAAPAKAYAAAEKAGIGALRVILPEASRKTVAKLMPEAEFASSTAGGGFAREALAAWLEAAERSDGVLLAGDLGHNSETTLLLESFGQKYSGALNLVGDAVITGASAVQVITLTQLQKLARQAELTQAITSGMSLHNLAQVLAGWTVEAKLALITTHEEQIVTAVCGQVSTTPFKNRPDFVELAAYASVWHLQNPTKTFEALTTAAYEFVKR